MNLPKTAYLWAALLILAIVVGGRIERKASDGAPPLTGTSFQEVVAAEQQTRLGFSSLGNMSLGKTSPLESAYKTYSKLAFQRPVPSNTRRALILAGALKKPLDNALITDLKSDLEKQKTPVAERDTELHLWKALYGTGTDKAESSDEARIKQMGLGILEDRALADLYTKLGRKADANTALARLTDTATHATIGTVSLVLLLGLAGMTGFGLLILFIVAASTKRWELIGRVATQPQRVPPGPLLDAFLFYLALYRIVSVVLGFILSKAGLPPSVPLLLLVQFGTGIASIFYARWRAQQSDGSLLDLGWSKKDLAANALYGVAGWCATIPIIFVAGLISQKIFHGSNNTPNPVLPLLASDRASIDRILIFVLAAFGAPLFEEFFFRGTLFAAFRKTTPWVLAALISGLIFAMVHPIQDWLPILALGFSFGTLREMRQSLVPGMVAHFLQNTVAFTMLSTLFGLLW
ncbi:MAG: type II CAAX endopeptidase family protein [Armatimonas sp.]